MKSPAVNAYSSPHCNRGTILGGFDTVKVELFLSGEDQWEMRE